MKRVAITNGTGIWFDSEKAEKFEEKTYWNGNNHISKATGSQLEHESIFLTKGGAFVLSHWSQFQGSVDTCEIISKEEASKWFAKQEFSDDELPKDLLGDVYGLELL